MNCRITYSVILSLLLLGCLGYGSSNASTTSVIKASLTTLATHNTILRTTTTLQQQYWNPNQNNYTDSHNSGYGEEFPSPVDCPSNGTLTYPPADLDSFDYIIPLGNLNPPGHTFPTDHIYFSFKTQSGNPKDFNSPTLPVKVFAPADITIFAVRQGTATTSSGSSTDYRLDFTTCPQVFFYYDHIAVLDPRIQAVLNTTSPQQCGENNQGGQDYRACFYRASLSLKAGDLIGIAGGPGSNAYLRAFDFGGYDLRTPELAFMDKQRIPGQPDQFLHTVCPLDYYRDASLKASLYQKVQNTKVNADGLPDCGTPMQDLPGTIQGNWNTQNSLVQQGPQDWNTQLAIVHLNTDPSQGVISLGGTLSQGGRTQFGVAKTGAVNREPREVTADGNVYCYQGQQITFGGKSAGHFLFQLIDNYTLKAEYSSGDCSGTFKFQQPVTYIR